ncbi:MAG: 1-(5-phosphoribosyl)-5-[(5-phosphoribosylamino)methylideneamino]imidazole-4-carboxamide isomerase, partial [Muribaculaceae bacterium]|nr:1-(5-phosphoribosyl)-5-[(5-phosphoribosylamino)methylideneamino]imidazole-4-carboxamide isomerase [Muribaculaceae bacterium]
KQPRLMEEWLEEFGGEKIILGADLRDGKVSVNGWLEDSPLTIHDLMSGFIPHGLKEAIVTDISKDGMLQGPSTQLYLDLAKRYPEITFTVSGGISSIDDILALDSHHLPRVIVGKAIYENRISLSDLKNLLTFRS